MNCISRFCSRIGQVLRNTRGAVAVHVGVIAIALIGFGALGIEIGYLLLKHREMQSAADGAAMSARRRRCGYGYPRTSVWKARPSPRHGGFIDGVDGTTVTINSPPTQRALCRQ